VDRLEEMVLGTLVARGVRLDQPRPLLGVSRGGDEPGLALVVLERGGLDQVVDAGGDGAAAEAVDLPVVLGRGQRFLATGAGQLGADREAEAAALRSG
jgi:hypothetical protein